MLKTLVKCFPWQILLMTLSPVVKVFAFGKIPQLYDYCIYLLIAMTSFFYYIANYRIINRENKLLSFVYKVLIIYVIAGCVKNCFVPSGLYPFFKLNICTAFLAFGSIFLFIYEPYLVRRVVRLWWKVVPAVFCLTFWKIERSQYIIMLYFCLLFLIFLPFFRKKRKFLIIGLLLLVAYRGMQQRIDYLSFLIPLLLYFIIKFHLNMGKVFYKIIFHFLMLLPLSFLMIFVFSGFNVLDMNSYIDDDIELESAGKMTEDTRSFLFEEAYVSSINNEYFWLGRTPCYGYDSLWAMQRDGDGLVVNGVVQRASEVFIVNMFTWTGIFGCVIFFLLYYYLGLETLFRTKNNLLSVLSLYIAFFWLISWISHYMFTPSLDFMILYMVIAICLNPMFRKMNNQEMMVALKRMLA